jgi:hypothetical protein
MNPKPQPNHREYIESLRAMTPEQRLNKAFELSALAQQAALGELESEFPDLTKAELIRIYLDRLVDQDKKRLSRIYGDSP